MRIRHILSAIDLSTHSDRALHEAVRLARRHGSRLTVLHAIGPRERFNEESGPRRARLSALSLAARKSGVKIRVSVQHGDAAGVILLHAQARNVDLIVLGGRPRQPRRVFRRDSTAETVVLGAPCPTLVVPTDLTSIRRAGAVLCAVHLQDGSAETIAHALDAADSLASASPRVVVLHVIRSTDANDRPRYRWRHDELEHRQDLHLAAWRKLQALIPTRARTSGLTRARVAAGDMCAQIGAVAKDIDARLIVVAATRKGAWTRRLFGMSTTRVIDTAPCPVLVVPSAERGEVRHARTLDRAA